MSAEYVFTGDYEIDAPREAVHGVLVDLAHYPEWWNEVKAVARIDDDHARVVCRSRLPYSLDFVATAVRRDLDCLEISCAGDLNGTVTWTLTPLAGGRTLIRGDQRVSVGPALSLVTPLLRRTLRWNHDQMMKRGMKNLQARLDAGEPRQRG